jgi:hypothetical protein
VLDDVLNKIDNKIVRDDKHITIKGYQCNTAQYEEWKASIGLKIGRAASSPSNNTDVLRRIASFDTLIISVSVKIL